MSSALKSGLVLLATFVLGAVFGGGMHAWLAPSRRPPPPMAGAPQGTPPLPRWMAQLELTAAQQEQARAIFEKYRPELQKVFEETFPKAHAVNEKMQAELRDVLTEAQREKLDAWQKAHPRGMGPGFGPGMHRGMGPHGMGPPGLGPPPELPPPPPDAPAP